MLAYSEAMLSHTILLERVPLLYSDHIGHEGAQPLWVDKVEVTQEGIVKVEHYAWSGGWRTIDHSYLITGSAIAWYTLSCVRCQG